ncbi:MAG TPA: hypothetical protein ENI85_09025 [Deltaproteobacteria bacterium]|nr:hypothetical protein [Deltaproteobacteria bacterium]
MGSGRRFFLSTSLLMVAVAGTTSAQQTRSFAMGFTPWPSDATTAAVDLAYAQISAHGDLIAHHFDGGVPWPEALAGAPLPAAVEAELAARVAATPPGHRVYLALSPLNGSRDGLAPYWNTTPNDPLPPAWAAKPFDDPDVIDAYANFSLALIDRFDPVSFNYGIEASELLIHSPGRWAGFVTFAQGVYDRIKAVHPQLPVFISVSLKDPTSSDAAAIRAGLPAILPSTDLLGISVYPYAFFGHANAGDPANLPGDWLDQAVGLAANRPLVITETGWIAEDLVIPTFGLNVPATPIHQADYLAALFSEANRLGVGFIVWFTPMDYDALWNGALGQDPLAAIWRDTGLYDETGTARPALGLWDEWLAKPLPPGVPVARNHEWILVGVLLTTPWLIGLQRIRREVA